MRHQTPPKYRESSGPNIRTGASVRAGERGRRECGSTYAGARILCTDRSQRGSFLCFLFIFFFFFSCFSFSFLFLFLFLSILCDSLLFFIIFYVSFTSFSFFSFLIFFISSMFFYVHVYACDILFFIFFSSLLLLLFFFPCFNLFLILFHVIFPYSF